jgi:hypothetical protein
MRHLKPYAGWIIGFALGMALIWASAQPSQPKIIPQWAPAPVVVAPK